MKDNIHDFVCDKDIKCPRCGGDMKIVSNNQGKSILECLNCKYKLK